MLGTYITFPELLIWLPLLAASCVSSQAVKKQPGDWPLRDRYWCWRVHCNTFYTNNEKYQLYNNVNYYWLKYIGNSFSIGLDGTGRLLTFLTALSFPMILIGSASNTVKQAPAFFCLMLMAQSGLMGVFLCQGCPCVLFLFGNLR